LYLDSTGSSYYFYVGDMSTTKKSYLSFDSSGKLEIKASNFHLEAGSFTGTSPNGI
jgi:hypothetical protein